MAVMANDGPSPRSPCLHLGLATHQPSKRHHAQSLLSRPFHDPRTLMFSNPTLSEPRLSPAATMSDDFRLPLRPCTAPLSCSLQHLFKLSLLTNDVYSLSHLKWLRHITRCNTLQHAANHYNTLLFDKWYVQPISFEVKFSDALSRAQSQRSKVFFHWNLPNETRELWLREFERAFEKTISNGIGCTWSLPYPWLQIDRSNPPPPGVASESFWVVRSQEPGATDSKERHILNLTQTEYLVLRWNLFLPALEIEPPKKRRPPPGKGVSHYQFVSIYIRRSICVCVCVCVCTHIYAHACTRAHAHIVL